MNSDSFKKALASKLAATHVPNSKAGQSMVKKGGDPKVTKRKENPTEEGSGRVSPKKAKVVDKGKRITGEAVIPFAFPVVEKDLHENSIFNPSYDHPQLVDKLVGKEDKGLIWDAGPGSACRMAQFMGLQLAVAGRELEKMWVQFGKERDEQVAKMKEKVTKEKDAEIARLKEEMEKRVADLKEAAKKKEKEFEQTTQEMTEQAATYMMTGFERAKFQVARVHPTVNVGMLNVLTEDEDFVWPPPPSDEERAGEESGGGN